MARLPLAQVTWCGVNTQALAMAAQSGIEIGLRGAQNLPEALPEIELSRLLGALSPVARP